MTTAPLAASSSSSSPRASMIGAKKLIWNTVLPVLDRRCRSCRAATPPGPLGEIAALLTSASRRLSWALSRSRISPIAERGPAGSARSTWMWSSGPASHGQFSGKGWREQVITRQPAEEKRFTVAWPMPREAPVRISVLRSLSALAHVHG